MTKRQPITVTMKLNKDGTMTMESTGGFDLRKIMPKVKVQQEEPKKGDVK